MRRKSSADDFVAKGRIIIVSINIMWSFLLLGIAGQWQKVNKPVGESIVRGQKNTLSVESFVNIKTKRQDAREIVMSLMSSRNISN